MQSGHRVFAHPVRVRFAECDMQGHVFNAHYLAYFDLAHTELLREAIGSYQRLLADGHDLVVAEARARYRAPAHFDDELEVGVTLEPLTASSMTSHFEVRRGGSVLTEGQLRHVCVDAAAGGKAPWPQWVRNGLKPYVSG
jgi:acyl-CoA thioester hydrolase